MIRNFPVVGYAEQFAVTLCSIGYRHFTFQFAAVSVNRIGVLIGIWMVVLGTACAELDDSSALGGGGGICASSARDLSKRRERVLNVETVGQCC